MFAVDVAVQLGTPCPILVGAYDPSATKNSPIVDRRNIGQPSDSCTAREVILLTVQRRRTCFSMGEEINNKRRGP